MVEYYYIAWPQKDVLPIVAAWMDSSYYTKWNKSSRERQALCDVPCMWNLRGKLELIGAEQRSVVARGGVGVCDMGAGVQRYKPPGIK